MPNNLLKEDHLPLKGIINEILPHKKKAKLSLGITKSPEWFLKTHKEYQGSYLSSHNSPK